MIGYLKELDFKKNNIKHIQKALEDTKCALEVEILNEKSIYNDNTKFQLRRVIGLIDSKNLLEMPLEDIEIYIKTLIDIINFIIDEL